MIPNHLLRKAAGRNVLLTLSHLTLEEAHSTMSTYATTKQVEDLETELKEDVRDIKAEIEKLGKKLDTQTAALRTEASGHFRWTIGGMVSGVVLILGLASFYITQSLPDKIEMGIEKSTYLQEKLGGLGEKTENVRSEIRRTENAKVVAADLKDAVSVDKSSLAKKLPDIKRLTRQIITEQLKLTARDYKEISQPLASHYISSKPPLKQQLWQALIDLANARSATEVPVRTLSKAEIENARARGGYFEGTDVDLSERTEWKDVIFKKCHIKISKPENKLTLTEVQFIECDFQLQPENERGQNLLEVVLENNGPEINEAIPYGVQTPTYRLGKPVAGNK